MNTYPDLSNISQITNNIFLSGIYPMDNDPSIIKKLNIKYILACLERNQISDIHNKVLTENPDVTILYIPYDDHINQNLWAKNNNNVNIIKYTRTMDDFNKLSQEFSMYDNKPMIEIGYHFINNAISSGNNILIHCMAGISRSVSTLTYFFMKRYNLSFENVYDFVKSKRSIVNPNDSFKIQLQTYHKKRETFKENDANKIIQIINRNYFV
ncbi:putative tyrosine-protein phosphatase [Cotonvirus japonicus]|uniref:Tyrosine-protein phosphatase n=1 Tax=Cotonvirus japonicus TaxID=2811091 RepID=A0ABM7NTF0_9VIRU|nr:putative tyrosine-protein phosphatase [Cotonvirus japonicus]BCS83443.1 putative tyrosine-protein phosphatase [Cotonvirus japonicus]